ncbi:MAG: metalloregulator ArsR/SmtB family transcription factor [Gammaproteobacteria bacterium]|nr:metalloregulator ArsR/SmtB family transcription factor [Gammaproteobacteria bacterium]
MCVCEITYALDVIQPKVSRHLAILKENEIVIDRRNGQWIYYKLNPAMPDWASKILAAACDGISREPQFKTDRTRLDKMPNRPVNSHCA